MSGQILVVPACEPGRGGGHLCRCISLVCDLRALEREARLFLAAETEAVASLLKSMNFNSAWLISEEEIKNEKFDFLILDRFKTSQEELTRWKSLAPVIGIDEGGQARDSFDFLIDILIPEKLMALPANISSPALLKFPELETSQRRERGDKLKVLVTFGQEDKAGLGLATAQELSKVGNMEITLLRGALSNGEKIEDLPNVQLVQNILLLAEHLFEYDLVITHYGITAYEALFAGVPVLLASPTKYHVKLAKTAGFLEFNLKDFTQKRKDTKENIYHGVSRSHAVRRTATEFHGEKKKLRNSNYLFLDEIKAHCEKLAARYKLREGANLASLFASFSPKLSRLCPVCGSPPARSVARFSERTYRLCEDCGLIYMDRLSPAPFEYEKEYFFESYKKQYGKTYLEDFANIKGAGKRRIAVIKKLLTTNHHKSSRRAGSTQIKSSSGSCGSWLGSSLLDIGCAYGPFLDAAREEGFSPCGLDPAQDAVNYVTETLGIQAVCGFFPDCDLPSDQPFDAVTLWYVIEHFDNCASVLSALKNILKPGGILAFSTPSFAGLSGRASLQRFLSASPADHWTVWSPAMCKKALKRFGFKVKKIKASGHHPERFPVLGKFAKSKKSPLYWPLLAISKLFRLADTFEVYARKY